MGKMQSKKTAYPQWHPRIVATAWFPFKEHFDDRDFIDSTAVAVAVPSHAHKCLIISILAALAGPSRPHGSSPLERRSAYCSPTSEHHTFRDARLSTTCPQSASLDLDLASRL
jgi:hypothetical protein